MDTSNNNTTTTATSGAITTQAEGAPPSTAAGRSLRMAIGFLGNDTDAQLVVDSGLILAGMRGNAAFPTPSPALADIATARNAYEAAVNASKDSRVARSLRKQQRQVLCDLLRKLAHYVGDNSPDVPTALTTGFTVQRVRSPVGTLPVPEDARFARGKVSGQAIARCRKVAKANAYQWRVAPAATPTAWQPVVTTYAAHCVFDGLVPLTAYVMQVCAAGTEGSGDWSPALEVIVL